MAVAETARTPVCPPPVWSENVAAGLPTTIYPPWLWVAPLSMPCIV